MGRRVAVVGFGTVGRATVSLLATRGYEVRIVQRRSPRELPSGTTFQSADVEYAEAMRRACAGVDEVTCCIGLPYDSALWARVWPTATNNLLDGCAASGARLVFADNLYLYGPQKRPLTEHMPLTTYGKKPRVRAEITDMWRKAHDAGKVRVVAVRAADFYGPDAPTSVVSTYGVSRLLAGKSALVPYPADELQDFTYVPDFARALVTLVDAPDDAYGQGWHVPNAPTLKLCEVLALAAARIGVTPRVSVLPRAVAFIAGLFDKEIAEVNEMRFQWDRPYIVDSSKFATRFWREATPFDKGLDATIASYRQRTSGGFRAGAV